MSAISSDSRDGARSRSPSRPRPAARQYKEEIIVCNPLKSLSDVSEFLNNPPVWRSLCIDLRPHSDFVVRNLDIVRQNHGSDHEVELERPEAFCHFDLDKQDVKRHRRKNLPKTLVCHDMANGYHDDCNIDGTGNYDAYTFYNWAAVDIFCYFSHHFVTVPPLGWINVGHAHGVKVIGTVITEWGDGADIWEELLSEPEAWKGFASNLVAIAKTLKFDGYLLNVENKITKPAELVEFVRYLHMLLHSEIPDSVLIWYDSVTVAGELAWQNTLNDKNKAFFEACDGIFTNYSWSERHVLAARAAAGQRRADVFVGLDVWGRNFLGGGQFNTQEAVKIAHKHGLSLAIFAPGWTHEALPPAAGWFRTYTLRERALWTSLWPFLNTKLPQTLPFSTSFCTGLGRKRRLYGEVLAPAPWYNLRHQQYQPSAALGPHGYTLAPLPPPPPPTPQPPTTDDPKPTPKRYQLQSVEEESCIELFLEDSFTGGGCLIINPFKLIRLFHCDFHIEDTLIACVVTKTLPDSEDVFLNIVLTVKDQNWSESRVVLAGTRNLTDHGIGALTVSAASGGEFKGLQRYLLLHQPGFYVSVENAYGWKVRYYSIPLAGRRVTSVSCCGGAPGPLLLGHFALCHKTNETG
ncbi:cytosolic endo-beta-N-acetylglucosaminidase isoform X2 [Cydia pomonella]|uniref:cytosolic endo-beta-N-acetylglucosaminidase isoform X2 n=1 Tax=Cydia pomonella TaxID=82600 RepID=UPI002ADDE3B3|nr:cytosolic endo-beta-N-acetylglucosaminidase isoform X2 [Cydia pomonella]